MASQSAVTHLTRPDRRDPSSVNLAFINASIAQSGTEDANTEHRHEHLNQLYSMDLIAAYDYVSMGHAATATLFASEVRLTTPVTSYLDLGTGTGFTAVACARILRAAGYYFRLILVDGMPKLLHQALAKFDAEFPYPDAFPDVYFEYTDIQGNLAGLQAAIFSRYQISGVSLITAQRVFLNVRVSLREEQLRQWAALLSPGGRLMLDIPHPRRCIGSLMIGTTPYQTCRIITEPQTWEECRRYARELAAAAGLVIVNDMPEQLPLHGRLENGASTVRDWIEKCKANTVPNNLSAQQYHWFGQRYARDAMEFYRKQGFRCTADIAAVIAVFELAPVAPVTVNIQHTKYTIDESLTGNAAKEGN